MNYLCYVDIRVEDFPGKFGNILQNFLPPPPLLFSSFPLLVLLKLLKELLIWILLAKRIS